MNNYNNKILMLIILYKYYELYLKEKFEGEIHG